MSEKKPVKKAPVKKAVKKPTPKPEVVTRTPFKPPLAKAVISCPYGKHGEVWACGWHTGVDYVAPMRTPVYAVAEGRVTAAQWGSAYGIHLVIQHGYHRFIYAHLDSKQPFKVGQKVHQGDLIGHSGNTGSKSVGPHLHLEARVSPFRYALDAVEPIGALK